jgi:hypothetical protein
MKQPTSGQLVPGTAIHRPRASKIGQSVGTAYATTRAVSSDGNIAPQSFPELTLPLREFTPPADGVSNPAIRQSADLRIARINNLAIRGTEECPSR